ncbi:aldo/keto reductase [Pannus brasiliensis CCIBt3594]|uniref:Aldo/keto reductase n=1 Tax=Pannus brasiliensis CCIBt3594 TaxID=1427578 RepID=A0AAW9QW65_9CHRO
MQYRRFGRTNLQMPVFSCGGMRYQFKWQDIPNWVIPEDNQRNVEAIVKQALEYGINHIETARGYGTSEMQLGKILPKLPREKIIVQTKVSPTKDPREFRRKFEQSLKFLGLDYVDLLGLHGINTAEILDDSVRDGGCWQEAKKLQEQGKARFIGFSTHAPQDLIVKTIDTNLFDYVNLHWYYIFQDNWPAIEAAREHDMGVFIISPSDKGGHLYNPPPRLVDLCAPLSPMVFNDLFCLSHPEVHTLSIGASRPTDFAEHLQTLPLLEKAGEILPPILDKLEQAMIDRFGENWTKTWRIGIPSWENVPNNINILSILWLRNLALAYDMVDFASSRYNLLGNGGHWFPGRPAIDAEKIDFRACLSASPHAARIPYLLADTHRLLAGESVQRLSRS